MSDIHDEIVQLMLNRFHIDNPDGVIVESKDCEQVADEIISLFRRQVTMSGQEYFDRFMAELPEPSRYKTADDVSGTGENFPYYQGLTVYEAAKRAAGIKKDA